MIKRSVTDEVQQLLEQRGSLASYDRSKLNAALDKAQFKLDTVRTTHDDPDSTRQFCSADVSVSLPATIIDLIDRARQEAGLETRRQVGNRAGLEVTASGFVSELEYSVQPTDDGQELIAESEGGRPLIDTLGDVFASYLLSDEIRAAKVESDKAAAAEKAAELQAEREQQQMAAEEQAAYDAYSAATLSEAIATNKLAAQELAAAWAAIPQDTRQKLAPLQTAWNKKTTARCRVEAAGDSLDKDEVRASQLTCETSALQARARELSRFASYNEDESEFSAD